MADPCVRPIESMIKRADTQVGPYNSNKTPCRGGFQTRPYIDIKGYSTISQSLPLRPKTSGEYISSALAGGTTKVPGVVARAT